MKVLELIILIQVQPNRRGRLPAFFFYSRFVMRELSIFVDESGDVGKYQPHSPYYIVTLVFHEQENDLTPFLISLNQQLSYLGYEDMAIHTEPLIRREEAYSKLSPNERRAILTKLFFFAIKAPITYKTFLYSKKEFENDFQLEAKMAKEVSSFIRENIAYFQGFTNVLLYYDGGQKIITRIMNTVLASELSQYEARKALPKDYRLSQVADLICTIKLIKKKIESGSLSKSEELIFHSKRDFYKDFVRKLELKEFQLF